MVLIIAFLVSYQQNPVFMMVLLAVGAFGYISFKRKKKGGKATSGGLTFRSGQEQGQAGGMNEMVAMMLMQQFFNSDNTDNFKDARHEKKERDKQIEKEKKVLMKLFED